MYSSWKYRKMMCVLYSTLLCTWHLIFQSCGETNQYWYRKLGAKRDFQLTCVRWVKLFLKLIANKTKTCFHPYSVFNYCSVHFSFLESLRACNPAASRPHRSVPDKVTLASLDLTAVIGSEGWWSVCVWGSRCFSRVPCSTFKEQGDCERYIGWPRDYGVSSSLATPPCRIWTAITSPRPRRRHLCTRSGEDSDKFEPPFLKLERLVLY